MRRAAVLTILVSLTLAAPRAQEAVTSPICECTGNAPPTERRDGGDGNPLRWQSLVRLVAQSSDGPLYCYERRVDNQSGRAVTDVYWPVAAYRKSLIDGMSHLCDATSTLGVVQRPDPNGPLTFNTGPAGYATTVRAPGAGWGKLAGLAQGSSRPPLSSTVQIPVRGQGVATITLTSSVRQVGGSTVLRFAMTNKGPNVRVFWNIPITPAFNALDYTPGAPPTVGAAQPFEREIPLTDPIAVAVADVHAYSTDGLAWLGSGIASAYASALGAPRQPVNLPAPPFTAK